jgi:hypothetical protein
MQEVDSDPCFDDTSISFLHSAKHSLQGAFVSRVVLHAYFGHIANLGSSIEPHCKNTEK